MRSWSRIESVSRVAYRLLGDANIQWIKAHEDTPGNEKADVLAGQAAEKRGGTLVFSAAWMKLWSSLNYNENKVAWNCDPKNHSTREIRPPPPKKSCLGKARNAVARVTAQIRTDHWRSVIFLRRIREQSTDKVLVLPHPHCRTSPDDRSHVLIVIQG